MYNPSDIRNACRRCRSRIPQRIRRLAKQRTLPFMLPTSRRSRKTNQRRSNRSKIRHKRKTRTGSNQTKSNLNGRLLRTLFKKRTNGLRKQHQPKTKTSHNKPRRTIKMPRPSILNLQIPKNGNHSPKKSRNDKAKINFKTILLSLNNFS